MFLMSESSSAWMPIKKAIDCDIDMVLMATPPGFRPLHYQAAIKAGKHVFMEKPCCVDAPGYRSLVETNKLADEKGLKVGVGLQRRHKKSYVSTIADIHDGKYGDLVLLQAYWNGGPIWWRDPIGDMSEMQKQVHNWYHFCWLSGDNICEQHIHNLDVCNWAKNAHPVEANGMGGDQMRRAERGQSQLFDHHFVEFTYPDGYRMYSQCRQVAGCFSLVSEYAIGNKGPDRIELGGNVSKRDVKDTHGLEFKFGEMQQEHYALLHAIRRDLPYNEGTLRRHEQHDGRARSHGHLQRQDRQVGRGRGEGQVRGARHGRLHMGHQTAGRAR